MVEAALCVFSAKSRGGVVIVCTGLNEQLDRIQEELQLDNCQLASLFSLTDQDLVEVRRGRRRNPALTGQISDLYSLVVDGLSPYRRQAKAELREHLREGGSPISLLRLLLLYPRYDAA